MPSGTERAKLQQGKLMLTLTSIYNSAVTLTYQNALRTPTVLLSY